jgi:phosphoribosyl 1,2-cyclic phosphate phosphodiesterase
MDATTHATMMQRFNYIFEGDAGYPAICEAKRLPPHGVGFSIDGPSGPIPVVTFDQDHGGVRSVGYRFGGVAYSSDLVDLDDAAFEALADLDVWIVDALRYRPHPSHAHVERTLSWIERAKPRRAILTNMHIDLDHAKLSSELPPGVEAAYDGLRLEHQLGAGFP